MERGDDSSQVAPEFLPYQIEAVHRYPRVLALATILYQLDRGKKETKGKGRDYYESGSVAERINEDLNEVRKPFTRKATSRNTWPKFSLQAEARDAYKAVLEACSDTDLFQQTLPGSPGESSVEERRAILYRNVVHPLKVLLQKLGLVDQTGNIQRQGPPGGLVDDRSSQPAGAKKCAAFLNPGMLQKIPDSGEKSRRWLQKIQSSQITKSLVLGYRTRADRIKIAILDTGYDEDSRFFSDVPQRKRRIKGWKDFVDGRPTGLDKSRSGHGTHVTSLAMKLAPAAEIYIARIARDTGDLDSASKNISEAILWVALECKDDIISMSFGFDDEIKVEGQPVISNAISEALLKRYQRVLFFAAAANDGGNSPEMFPARHPNVISIRGSNEKGSMEHFSPPPGQSGQCFMTLGIDVPGAALAGNENDAGEVCRSGTSVSTPIAAGIAAAILGYARLHEPGLRKTLGVFSEKVSEVWTMAGMRRMFAKMSTPMGNHCSYLHFEDFEDQTEELRLGMFAQAVWNNTERQ